MDRVFPVAVLGSNCFTAAHLIAELLDRSCRVVGVSRSPQRPPLYLPYAPADHSDFSFHQLDLASESDAVLDLLDETKPEVVVNVAALSEVFQSNLTPEEYYRINCQAVVQLANRLKTRKYLRRYVHISTAEVYGNCRDPVSDVAQISPTTPYAASKAAADLYLATLVRHFDFPAILIRSTNVYGKHQQLFKIIPRTVIRLLQGEKIELHDGGRAVRPFIHIRDVVAGILAAADRGRIGGIYHFSTDLRLSIAGIVRRVCERMGRNFEESTVSVEGVRSGQDGAYLLDCSRSARDLGWSPRVSLDEGINEVIGWVTENQESILSENMAYVHPS